MLVSRISAFALFTALRVKRADSMKELGRRRGIASGLCGAPCLLNNFANFLNGLREKLYTIYRSTKGGKWSKYQLSTN